MSLLGEVKKIAGDAIGRNAQELISNNAEQLIGDFIKEQLRSGNVQQITTVITELISKQGSIGGIQALIAKFDTANLGSLAQSWISSGKNSPLSMGQVTSVFGENWLKTLSEKVGINSMVLTGLISYFLPSVVDQATKDGNIPEDISERQVNVVELLSSFVK